MKNRRKHYNELHEQTLLIFHDVTLEMWHHSLVESVDSTRKIFIQQNGNQDFNKPIDIQ